MILTKGGATRKIAEEILTDLESANMEDSLLTAQMLIALVFSGKRAADREWLRKKWNLMSNKLRDNWFYQEITEEAREEGREKGREEEHKLREEEHKLREEEHKLREEERKLREEERKQEMERLRQMLFSFVQARFADRKMELQARGQAALIDDPRILQKLILKVGLAQTAEEAQDYLLSWPELEQEAS